MELPLKFKFPSDEKAQSFISELAGYNGRFGLSPFRYELAEGNMVNVFVEISEREVREAIEPRGFVLNFWLEKLSFGLIKQHYKTTGVFPKAAVDIVNLANQYGALNERLTERNTGGRQ